MIPSDEALRLAQANYDIADFTDEYNARALGIVSRAYLALHSEVERMRESEAKYAAILDECRGYLKEHESPGSVHPAVKP